MESVLGLRASKAQDSPLQSVTLRSQLAESSQRQLARSEWGLWFSAFLVTLLSLTAFVLTAIPSYFQRSEHFYEIRSDQARWGILCLILLFNGWLVYRQWKFRRLRAQLSDGGAVREVQVAQGSVLDPVTGLHTRAFVEQQLGKEIVRARRLNCALSLAAIHLEDFSEMSKRYGPSATDEILKELARRLKKACRGSDFAVRLANDDFLLVLPECESGEVGTVLKRLGALEMVCAGRKVNIAYTTGWVDYRAGEPPAELLKRATQLLHLYKNADKESLAYTPAQ